MYKQFVFVLCLILAIGSVGCSLQRSGTKNSPQSVELTTEKMTKWTEIYKITFESYLEQDTALNAHIDFIAIDLTALEFANNYDRKAIMDWFEMYHVPIKNTNFNGLKEEGLFDEDKMYIPDGVLLSIGKITETDNEIIIEGTKYRSGEGANGFRTKWRLNNGVWKFIETVMTWIS